MSDNQERKVSLMDELGWRKAVEATKKGDKKAFEELYNATQRAVYFTCLKLLANEDSAKDMMQDTYMTALERLETLEDGAKFPMWINRIAVNKCMHYFRKAPVDSLDEQTEQGLDLKDDESFIPEEYVTNEAKRKVIMQIITTQLSDVQRQVIIMYYYDEMSLEEIAKAMDCPVKTVSSRLCSARQKIKEAVLIYEKANDDRLHMLVPVPILTQILRKEAASISVPDISPVLLSTHFFNAASNASASTISTSVAGGNSKMVGFFTGKVVAAIAAGVIAVGGVTAAVVLSKNGKSSDSSSASASSSVIVTDTSSSAADSSSQADSSQADSSASSSSESSKETNDNIEYTVDELSATAESVKGKTVAEAKQIFADKLGIPVDKWEADEGKPRRGYHYKFEKEIVIGSNSFDEIVMVELVDKGVISNEILSSVELRKEYKDLDHANTYQRILTETLDKQLVKNTDKRNVLLTTKFWKTSSGNVSVNIYDLGKGYRRTLALQFTKNFT